MSVLLDYLTGWLADLLIYLLVLLATGVIVVVLLLLLVGIFGSWAFANALTIRFLRDLYRQWRSR